MSHKRLIKSKVLLQLEKQGQLKPVFEQFKKELNPENLIRMGHDSSMFTYDEGRQVIQLCSKQSTYFQNLYSQEMEGKSPPTPCLNGAPQFKQQIEDLQPWFLPINTILYEDENVFVYTQDKYTSLRRRKNNLSPLMVLKIFQIIQTLLKKNLYITNLSPRNFGIADDCIVVHDYNDLHPLQINDGIITGEKLGKLSKYLTPYLLLIYGDPSEPKSLKKMQKLKGPGSLKKIKKAAILPPTFIRFLAYLYAHSQTVEKDKLLRHLKSCIAELQKQIQILASQNSQLPDSLTHETISLPHATTAPLKNQPRATCQLTLELHKQSSTGNPPKISSNPIQTDRIPAQSTQSTVIKTSTIGTPIKTIKIEGSPPCPPLNEYNPNIVCKKGGRGVPATQSPDNPSIKIQQQVIETLKIQPNDISIKKKGETTPIKPNQKGDRGEISSIENPKKGGMWEEMTPEKLPKVTEISEISPTKMPHKINCTPVQYETDDDQTQDENENENENENSEMSSPIEPQGSEENSNHWNGWQSASDNDSDDDHMATNL